MKATTPWITYRTRFLVKAKQLTTSLTFTDLLGRQHSGRKGDYLVESSDGVLSIAPRQIFEDIYVPVLAGETSAEHSDETTQVSARIRAPALHTRLCSQDKLQTCRYPAPSSDGSQSPSGPPALNRERAASQRRRRPSRSPNPGLSPPLNRLAAILLTTDHWPL